ncbi:MAG: hypothetical protein QG635_2501 [Bacteroidota bacterium]|nr:hypothetical protein [Bacteroidota bacterium]
MNDVMKIYIKTENDLEELLNLLKKSEFPKYELHSDYYYKIRDNNRKSRLPLLGLIGGIIGLVIALYFQYWSQSINYPMNLGGKPFFSWTASIPPAFEMTILFAALFIFTGFLISIRKKLIRHENYTINSYPFYIEININNSDELDIFNNELIPFINSKKEFIIYNL